VQGKKVVDLTELEQTLEGLVTKLVAKKSFVDELVAETEDQSLPF
jgi:hypothetical protein